MARFGIQLKSRRKAGMGGFHAEYLNDRTAARQRKQMGYIRSLFSAVSLLFGGLMIYVGLHYIPAFVSPSQVIKLASNTGISAQSTGLEKESPFGKVLGPYIDMFSLDRAYINGGQSVEIKYNLPNGAVMDVIIRQCRRLWVVEIFECQIVSEQTLRISGQRGKQSFTLPQTGFYHFQETISLANPRDNYRVVWARS